MPRPYPFGVCVRGVFMHTPLPLLPLLLLSPFPTPYPPNVLSYASKVRKRKGTVRNIHSVEERKKNHCTKLLLRRKGLPRPCPTFCCFYARSLPSATSCSSGSTQWRILWTIKTTRHCSASDWCRRKCSNRNTFSESFHLSVGRK